MKGFICSQSTSKGRRDLPWKLLMGQLTLSAILLLCTLTVKTKVIQEMPSNCTFTRNAAQVKMNGQVGTQNSDLHICESNSHHTASPRIRDDKQATRKTAKTCFQDRSLGLSSPRLGPQPRHVIPASGSWYPLLFRLAPHPLLLK